MELEETLDIFRKASKKELRFMLITEGTLDAIWFEYIDKCQQVWPNARERINSWCQGHKLGRVHNAIYLSYSCSISVVYQSSDYIRRHKRNTIAPCGNATSTLLTRAMFLYLRPPSRLSQQA